MENFKEVNCVENQKQQERKYREIAFFRRLKRFDNT